jgi:hypothetical protein
MAWLAMREVCRRVQVDKAGIDPQTGQTAGVRRAISGKALQQ